MSGGSSPIRLRRRLAHGAAALAVASMGAALAGFVRISFSPGAAPFFWDRVPVSYVINSSGSDDVPDLSDTAAVRLAFQTWERLPESSIAFVEDTTADARRRDFNAQDIHLVVWDEDASSGLFSPGSGIVALTPMLASTSDGRVFDADIIFNGALPFSTRLTGGAFDVLAVATHEVGHFIGLDHGGGPFATMHSTVLAGATTARSLSRDEEAAASTVYPQGARGRIAGTITRGGVGVRFGQVVAVDVATGEYGGSTVTDASGNYTISGLTNGSYDLYVEPLDGPFVPNDTISLNGQQADSFATTTFPGGSVTVTASGVTAASWTVVGGVAGINIERTTGGRLTVGTTGNVVTLEGPGVGDAVTARVTGTGVAVTSLERIASSRLRLTLSVTANAARGVRCIEVVDAASRRAMLTAGIDVHDPDPRVTTVAPAALDPGMNVTIDGEAFGAGPVYVVIGGQVATNVVLESPTRVRCAAPASPGVTTAVDVVVIRFDGREARATGAVTYNPAPVPQSVDPPTVPTAGGSIHTIYGTGFATPLTVAFGSGQANVLSVTGTEIRVTAPPGSAGAADVVVTIGERSGVLRAGVTYVAGTAPFVSSFTPTSGPTLGGTTVTILGTGFASNATVRFGARAATGVTVASATQITCVTPAQTGAVEVRVTNPSTNLTGVSTTLYSYGDAPVIPSGGGSSSGCALAPSDTTRGPSAVGALALVGLLLVRRRRHR